MAGGRDALHTGRLSNPSPKYVTIFKREELKKLTFILLRHIILSVQCTSLDNMHSVDKAFATASIDLDRLALLSCRLRYFSHSSKQALDGLRLD